DRQGQAIYRLERREDGYGRRRGLAVGQGFARADRLQATEGHGIAGRDRRGVFAIILAGDCENAGNPLLMAIAAGDRIAIGKAAGKNAAEGQLAAVARVYRLEDLGET